MKYPFFIFEVRKDQQAEKLVHNTGKGKYIKGAMGVGGSEKGSFPDGEQKDQKDVEKGQKVKVFPFISYSDESPFWDYWF